MGAGIKKDRIRRANAAAVEFHHSNAPIETYARASSPKYAKPSISITQSTRYTLHPHSGGKEILRAIFAIVSRSGQLNSTQTQRQRFVLLNYILATELLAAVEFVIESAIGQQPLLIWRQAEEVGA